MTGVHRCYVSSASGAQKFGGKKNYEKNNVVTTVYEAFPLRALQVAFGYVVAFTTMK